MSRRNKPVSVRPQGTGTPYYKAFGLHKGEWSLIGQVLQEYEREYSHRSQHVASHTASSLNDFLTVCHLGEDMPFNRITKDTCKQYKAALLARQGKNLSFVTIDQHLKKLAHFLKWAMGQDYCDKNYVLGLMLPSRLVTSARIRKEGFTPEQMGRIFAALPPFRHHVQPDKREFYWLVLALAHSGARLSEILQLYTSDVRDVQSIPVFDIKEGKGQHLKNVLSIRQTPLHSNLIALGFLDWCRAQPEGRLFPVLYGRGITIPSRWFSTLLLGLRMKTPALTLHSFRHALAQALERTRCHYSISRRLQGHAAGTDVQGRTYNSSLAFDLKELQEALEAVTFPTIS